MNNSAQNQFYKERHKYRLAHLIDPDDLEGLPQPLANHYEDIPIHPSPYELHISRDGRGISTISGRHIVAPNRQLPSRNNPELTIRVPSSLDTQTIRATHHLLKNFEGVLRSELQQTGNDYEPGELLSGHHLIHNISRLPYRVSTNTLNKNIETPPDIDQLEAINEGQPLYDPGELEEEMSSHANRIERNSGHVTQHIINHPVKNSHEVSQMLSRLFGSILLDRIVHKPLPNYPGFDLLEDKIKNKREYQEGVNPDVPYNREAQHLLSKDNSGHISKAHALVEYFVPHLKKYIDHLLSPSQIKYTLRQFLNTTRDSELPLKEAIVSLLQLRPTTDI